ncbi:efflux RND transporter periplasmic adaptor subunit [Runella zeae]|uniref:efflux RND transporter periplasmic adaptor subunit n=1 Tax=Runella zeae TaxID=94255 RepID=UPI000684F0E8|nr:efflux RND transporter periplasmic adaptor subunit [Runella zeae]
MRISESIYSVVTAMLLIPTLIHCTSSESDEVARKKSTKKDKPKINFEIGTPSRQKVGQMVQLPAEFKAFQEVNIYPKADGFVEQVLVDRGSIVRKGQVLMILDSPESEERLVAARSNTLKANALLVASKEHYRRLKSSSKVPGSVSALDLETAHARMMADSASLLGEEANLRALTKIKSYLTVTAPFDGIITERNVHPGALVGLGAKMEGPMMVLQQQNPLRLVIDVPETYAMSLKKGDAVSFSVNTLPNQTFREKISRRASNMNEKFRSETVEIDVPNNAGKFKPGMFAEVILSAEGTPNALTVPSSAVIASTERQYIVRVTDGRAQFVDVRKGQQSGELTEVFGNLNADDKILLNPRDDLKEGTLVQ